MPKPKAGFKSTAVSESAALVFNPPTQPKKLRRSGKAVVVPASGSPADSRLAEIIRALEPGDEAVFQPGRHVLSETLTLDKSIRLSSAPGSNAVIAGVDLPALIVYQGSDTLEIEGLTLALECAKGKPQSELPSNVVTIRCGGLEMSGCTVCNERTEPKLQRDPFWGGPDEPRDTLAQIRDANVGLLLLGTSAAVIRGTSFRNHKSGLSALDRTAASISDCVFMDNKYGLAARDEASIRVEGSEFSGNRISGIMGFERSSIVASAITQSRSRWGAWIGGAGKASVSDSSFTHNSVIGAYIEGSTQVILQRNRVIHQCFGFSLSDTSQAAIEGNSIQDSSGQAIWLSESARAQIRRNAVSACETGVELQDNAGALIEDNQIAATYTGVRVHFGANAKIGTNEIAAPSPTDIQTAEAAAREQREGELKELAQRLSSEPRDITININFTFD